MMSDRRISPFSSSSGRRENTSQHWKRTVFFQSVQLGVFRCLIHCQLGRSHPVMLAPAIPAFNAKEPVWVKQSSKHLAPLHSFWMARRCISGLRRSSFSTIFHAHHIMYAVFYDFHFASKGAERESFSRSMPSRKRILRHCVQTPRM